MMRHNYLRVGQRILVGFPKINNCSILNWNIWFQTTIFHGQKFQNICCSAKYKNENEISRTVFFKQVAFFKEKIETFPKFAMFLYFLFNNFHHKTNAVLTFFFIKIILNYYFPRSTSSTVSCSSRWSSPCLGWWLSTWRCTSPLGGWEKGWYEIILLISIFFLLKVVQGDQ